MALSKRQREERWERLFIEGEPKHIRCYDNGGETADRYTVVFTHRKDGYTWLVHMSADPYWAQGVCIHDALKGAGRDLNKWGFAPGIGRKSIFGKRIAYADLPADCREVVLDDYCELWRLPSDEN